MYMYTVQYSLRVSYFTILKLEVSTVNIEASMFCIQTVRHKFIILEWKKSTEYPALVHTLYM